MSHSPRARPCAPRKGMQSTYVSIVTEDANPLSSPDRGVREKARDHLRHAIDCGHAMGAELMCGPFHSPLGIFSGAADRLQPSCVDWPMCSARRQRMGKAQACTCQSRRSIVLNATCSRRWTRPPNYVVRSGIEPSFMYDTFHANIEEQDPVAASSNTPRNMRTSIFPRTIAVFLVVDTCPGPRPFGRSAARAIIGGWSSRPLGDRSLHLRPQPGVWRDLFPDLETLFTESLRMVRGCWAEAG